MPKKPVKEVGEDSGIDNSDNDDFGDEEPIPVKRDTRIFNIKKENEKKEEGFEEDVFV